MNKKLFFTPLVAAALATTLTGCDEDAWNDHLNGFEDADDAPISNVQTINYTLAESDYTTIGAKNGINWSDDAEVQAELNTISSKKVFPTAKSAREFIPAFLNTTNFSYFTLTDGSAVKVTYKLAENMPAELAEAAAAQAYKVTEEDYQQVWESTEDYINAFAPSHPASKYLPGLLAANAEAGNDYCVVTYEASAQEPVFGNAGGNKPEPWESTSIVANLKKGDTAEIKGIVTSICRQGYTVTDNTGTILVYMGSGFDATSVEIGNQVIVSGDISSYNKGLQVAGSSATVEVKGKEAVKYPTATVLDGAALDELLTSRTADEPAYYVSVTGKVAVNGYNVNILVDGAATAQGSLYQGTDAQKALLTDGETVTLTGYFTAIAGGRYISIIATSVNGKACAPQRAGVAKTAAAAEVPTTKETALYHLEDGKWVVPSDFVILSAADYTALGQKYQNLSNANTLLPKFLAQKFPYASADDVKNVMYLYYNSSSQTTYYVCDQYAFDGTAWVLNNGVVEAVDQFVKKGSAWVWDPSVVITLPGGKGQDISAKYYQACVDWVYNNICVPMGDTSIKSGKFYVTSYGNNEYYCGTSAYQGNVDLRASAAKTQYAAEYESMSDDEVVALMKKRFMEEVMPGALSTLHPDAVPVDGIDVTFTVNFAVYDGTTTTHTAVFKVVAPGTFEPVSCTWDK